MINVTKSYLPPLAEYVAQLEKIWESVHLTNQGPLVSRLEAELESFLGARRIQVLGNGTIALQLSVRALGLEGEIITTPFSYVATTSSILWEHCTPVFVDVEDRTFCIDPALIERAITPRTRAIMATHVYGYPCDVHAIAEIAARHGLKVIYDGAHAFGVRLDGASLLRHGDVTTLSFHATKLFHTVEGGAVVCSDDRISESMALMKSFGHRGDDHHCLGINAKSSEFHAAMGLCVLPRVADLIAARRRISERYDLLLRDAPLRRPRQPENLDYNYAYHPVVLRDEATTLRLKRDLEAIGVGTRRYFYPSLNELPYVERQACPVSEEIARRVLCLPLYPELASADVDRIAEGALRSLRASETR